MEEEEARAWVQSRFDVPRETMARLDDFARFLGDESARQNLVSSATLPQLWSRHIADSAQLLQFAPNETGNWIDLGTGAGFPGLIVATLHQGIVTLIEARRLRVEFLERAAEVLQVKPIIIGSRVELAEAEPQQVISARAFAPLPKLLALGSRFSTRNTIWVLPKGRNAQSELEGLDPSWQGSFRLEPSLTDPEARIIVASGVGGKGKTR